MLDIRRRRHQRRASRSEPVQPRTFELFLEKNPPMDPVFTLFPATGDLDIMAALEPTEAGRALERGFVTETTTVITGLDRVYSTAEKMSAGDGTIDGKPMMESLEKAAKDVICLDVSNLAGSSASRINSVMFGAIIGERILPHEKHGRAAIEEKGVAVDLISQAIMRVCRLPGMVDPKSWRTPTGRSNRPLLFQ